MGKIKKMTIHAGHNPSGKIACGASGILNESNENRYIAKKVAAILKENKITAYNTTVDNGSSQTDVLRKICTKCNAKTSQLDVSIHFNSGANDKKGNGKTTGTEVLITSPSAMKKNIANNFLAGMKKLGFTNRGIKTTNSLYFLNHTKAPAMLFEVCFVDDKDDAALYKKHRDEIAHIIAKAIMSY